MKRDHNINGKRLGMKIQNDNGNIVALCVYVHASMPSIMNAMLLRLYITCFTHIWFSMEPSLQQVATCKKVSLSSSYLGKECI